MSLRPRRRLRRNSRGSYDLNLPPDERALLQALPQQLTATLERIEEEGEEPGEEVRRLFPVAHPRDDDAERDYARQHRPGLLAHHLRSLEILARTADAKRLAPDELNAWLAALNDLRLAIGSALHVTEEPSEPDPDAPDYADWVCYHYLSFLQTEVIDVLEETLPPPTPGAGDDLPEDPWGEPLGGLRWDGTPLPE